MIAIASRFLAFAGRRFRSGGSGPSCPMLAAAANFFFRRVSAAQLGREKLDALDDTSDYDGVSRTVNEIKEIARLLGHTKRAGR